MYSKFKSYGSIYVSIYQILNHDIQVLKVNFQACEQFMPLWMSLFLSLFSYKLWAQCHQICTPI